VTGDRPDSLRARLRRGGAIGLWANIPSPLTAEAAAAAGADYVVVDQQHGAVDPSVMLGMLQAIAAGGAPAMVRVARNEPFVIGNALDLGAAGVIVPLVESAEEAARAVAATRYAPEGVRSFGALRPGADEDPLCLVMVETARALEQVEAIAATPGLDGIYIGPSDLALSLGHQPTLRLEHAAVLEAIHRVHAACAAAGRLVGLHCLTPEDAAQQSASGRFALVTAGGDLIYLRDALARALAQARAS
jgi:4-hydroxy-2-oxoheptanedioate aldolase